MNFMMCRTNLSSVWAFGQPVSLSFAAPVAHFHCILICYLYHASIKVKGSLEAASLVSIRAWSNNLPLDVLAPSHLQCLPQHHCIMLHLHRIASALPLQDRPPFHSPPLLPSPTHPLPLPLSCFALFISPSISTPSSLSPVSGWCQSAGAWQ